MYGLEVNINSLFISCNLEDLEKRQHHIAELKAAGRWAGSEAALHVKSLWFKETFTIVLIVLIQMAGVAMLDVQA